MFLGNSLTVPNIVNLPGQGGGGGAFEYTAIDNSFSMLFDGGSSYFDTGEVSVSGTNFSTSFWIKIDNPPSSAWNRQQVFPARPNNNTANFTIGHITPRGLTTRQLLQLQGTDNTGANPATYTTQNINLLGTGWNHVVFTHNITTTDTYAYVNGVAQTWTAFSGTPTNVPFIKMPYTYSTFRIGAFNTSEFFEGFIDEAAIFNEVLSESTIQAIYDATANNPGKVANLSETPEGQPVAWYRMGD